MYLRPEHITYPEAPVLEGLVSVVREVDLLAKDR